MTLTELFEAAYAWALQSRMWIALIAVLIPVVGTVAAWIGKGGKTDADGRFIASVVVGAGLLAIVVEILAIVIGTSVMHRSVLDAHILLLAAPVICLAGCLLGIRLVFPLNQLASVKTFTDIGLFVGACLVVIWLFSKFRGWGIIFFGGIGQLVAIAVLGLALMRRLYRRAFKAEIGSQ